MLVCIHREFAAMVAAAFRRLERSELVSEVGVEISSGVGHWIGKYRALRDRDVILLRREVAAILPTAVLLEVAGHEVSHAAASMNVKHPNYMGHGLPWSRNMRRLGLDPRVDIVLSPSLHQEVEKCLGIVGVETDERRSAPGSTPHCLSNPSSRSGAIRATRFSTPSGKPGSSAPR